ncbi:hypothetical protein DXG01_015022 [Tephrocybe rancida]|nr:hypothetical protein DXG01_015022 [Tephrocybe rancida]
MSRPTTIYPAWTQFKQFLFLSPSPSSECHSNRQPGAGTLPAYLELSPPALQDYVGPLQFEASALFAAMALVVLDIDNSQQFNSRSTDVPALPPKAISTRKAPMNFWPPSSPLASSPAHSTHRRRGGTAYIHRDRTPCPHVIRWKALIFAASGVQPVLCAFNHPASLSPQLLSVNLKPSPDLLRYGPPAMCAAPACGAFPVNIICRSRLDPRSPDIAKSPYRKRASDALLAFVLSAAYTSQGAFSSLQMDHIERSPLTIIREAVLVALDGTPSCFRLDAGLVDAILYAAPAMTATFVAYLGTEMLNAYR